MRPDEARFSSQHDAIVASRIELDKSESAVGDIEKSLEGSLYQVLEQALAGANWQSTTPKALIFTGPKTTIKA